MVRISLTPAEPGKEIIGFANTPTVSGWGWIESDRCQRCDRRRQNREHLFGECESGRMRFIGWE